MVVLDVTRNTHESRFELLRDGQPIGTLAYTQQGGTTVLRRIEVAEEFSGQGLAARFTEVTLAELASGAESVIPVCPFVRGYMIRNPQWQDLVPADHREELRA